ncbi:peptide-binding protein [Paenibacillus mucilaginosus]|uniref:Oligopeptide ABC transporter (Oligopeptide-binding protein) n=1 Tax=Paenibacillus mucilaginosus (strain KNP414) TaxID=1036673 RepID=F8FJY3_PAEMK|nr:peptide-binding protein [Paenibacillus mucilaginosus]AEI44024.1 oligopeptide ABC transporter (oligopeptide-binding protein) [Paenibacillus mucilaginosus KNP414]MCG7212488.1 peptide-binding protein [Paenibacillus mucilaginosus]WDM25477.1 peptide-binding protein [Paenibacillus mucilaginosus]
MKLRSSRPATALSALLSAAVLLSACTSGENTTAPPAGEQTPPAAEAKKEKTDGGEIIWAYLSDPQGFSDLWATTTTSSEINDLVTSSLYHYSTKQDLDPDLAVGQPTFSEDKKEMTVKIRTDAKYTDGQPVTADDVVFTYNVALSPDYKGPRKGVFEQLAKVEKVDEATIKFTFKQPFASFIDLMAYNILPKHILGETPVKDMDKAPFIKQPVGSGPYKLEEWKQGQYLRLVRNENYYGGKPAVEKVTVKIIPDANSIMAQLQTGEVNASTVPADNLAVIEQYAKTSGKIKLQKGIKSSTYLYVAWNLTNPLFQDKKVRQALTMAIDRQGIVDGVQEGQGVIVHSQTPPTYWSYTENVPKFPFDAEKAKAMLAEAGWKDSDGDTILDKDGKKFEFEMQVNQGNKVREKAVTVIQQQLKKIGISVQPRVVEGSAFSKNFQSKQFESIFYGWNISGDPNPKGIWHSAEIEHGLNTVTYKNPEVDKLIDEDLQTFDTNKRKELLGKIDALIAEDQPYTFLYSPTTTVAYPANLEGFNPARDSLREVEKWYFTK